MESGEWVGRRYLLEHRLGHGGMGEVFRAKDTVLGRTVAIKRCLHSDPDSRQRFEKEAMAQAALNHPGIVAIYDFVPDARAPVIVMEFFPGETLQSRVSSVGGLEMSRALRIVTAVAEALAYVHHQRVFHRDIKPSNILLAS